ncbi:MAG: protein translocase subunit SecD [Chloroflexota bacterium]|nr:protein translocase subunit SecD [Chloroflexota bacterium]
MRRRSTLYWFLFIVVLTALGTWVALPGDRRVLGRQAQVVEGLDLQGGLQVLLEARPAPGQQVSSANMNDAREIIEQRVNALGVSEPVVQRQGSNRISVELAGVKDVDTAIRTFQGTGLLEFVDSGDTPLPQGTLVNTTLGPATQAQQRNQNQGTPTAGPQTTTAQPTGTAPAIEGTGVAAQTTPAPKAPGPATQGTPVPVPTSDPALANTPPDQLKQTYRTIMTGKDISKASAGFDPQTNAPEVQFTLTSEGARKFSEYTSANVGKYNSIVLDKKVVSSPRVESPITSGNGRITGVSLSEARTLAIQLRYGSLPVPLQIVSSNTVGASLGRDSIDRSIHAGLIGVLAVALFMVFYYRLPGLLSVIALGVYTILVFALFKLIPVTLTLAGIAGFVLSIGMAVDANVLIFARMKDELRRGRSLLQAVDAGFRNAWPSIRDSNISTLITCAVLIWFGGQFGASIIRGFAITLAVGVLVSMFSAITVTRTLLNLVVTFTGVRNLWLWGIHPSEAAPPTQRPGAGPALGSTRAR